MWRRSGRRGRGNDDSDSDDGERSGDLEMGNVRDRGDSGSEEDEEGESATEDGESSSFLRRRGSASRSNRENEDDDADYSDGDIEMGSRRKETIDENGKDDSDAESDSSRGLNKKGAARSVHAFKHTIISFSLGLACVTALLAYETLCVWKNTCSYYYSSDSVYGRNPAVPPGSAAASVVPLALLVLLAVTPLGLLCSLAEARKPALIFSLLGGAVGGALILVSFVFFSQKGSAASTAAEYWSGPESALGSHDATKRFYVDQASLQSEISSTAGLYGLFSLIGGGFVSVAAFASGAMGLALPSGASSSSSRRASRGRRDDGL